MTDREKLVKILNHLQTCGVKLNGYKPVSNKEIANYLIAHGVTVRQMQKPLTVEELKQMCGCPVWVEVIDHKVFADAADDFDGWGLVRPSLVRMWDEKRADLVKVDYHFEDYLKEWRCWAEKPTEEERKAAEW